MNTKAKKISSLSFAIFTVLLSLYLIYQKEYVISSAFILYGIFFISIFIVLSKNNLSFQKTIENNSKHYALNVGFMVCWLIIYIIDLKNNFAAFEHIQSILIGATTIILFTYIYKLFRN